MQRLRLANLRAAWWASKALSTVRRELRERGLQAVATAPSPPPLPAASIRGVDSILYRRKASCLERSIVLQRWHADHGRPLELVIGVRAPDEEFGAHAWLEGGEPPHGHAESEFREILRRPVPGS